MKKAIWIMVIILLIAHQDFWYWTDDTLVYGFMPIGLLYHVGISISAGFVWFLATIFAWPKDLDIPVDQSEAEDSELGAKA